MSRGLLILLQWCANSVCVCVHTRACFWRQCVKLSGNSRGLHDPEYSEPNRVSQETTSSSCMQHTGLVQWVALAGGMRGCGGRGGAAILCTQCSPAAAGTGHSEGRHLWLRAIGILTSGHSEYLFGPKSIAERIPFFLDLFFHRQELSSVWGGIIPRGQGICM